jgi:hypothetical protein
MKPTVLATLLQLAITTLIALPALVSIPPEVFTNLHQISSLPYYLSVYFVIPLALTAIIFVSLRVDSYEVWHKFRDVYVLMAIELALILLGSFSRVGISPQLISMRITLFFLHFYYYVPVIYFCSRPYRKYTEGAEAAPFADRIRRVLAYAFGPLSRFYLSFMIILIVFFGISAA